MNNWVLLYQEVNKRYKPHPSLTRYAPLGTCQHGNDQKAKHPNMLVVGHSLLTATSSLWSSIGFPQSHRQGTGIKTRAWLPRGGMILTSISSREASSYSSSKTGTGDTAQRSIIRINLWEAYIADPEFYDVHLILSQVPLHV